MNKDAAVSFGRRINSHPSKVHSLQQDGLRELAALYPLQAGSLYTTFTDLMLCEFHRHHPVPREARPADHDDSPTMVRFTAA
jgi:hypothetical protein